MFYLVIPPLGHFSYRLCGSRATCTETNLDACLTSKSFVPSPILDSEHSEQTPYGILTPTPAPWDTRRCKAPKNCMKSTNSCGLSRSWSRQLQVRLETQYICYTLVFKVITFVWFTIDALKSQIILRRRKFPHVYEMQLGLALA